jgi:hypothetical protein
MTHPITPPPELVQQWIAEFYGTVVAPGEATTDIATRAAQWGADQELDACVELTRDNDGYDAALGLRAARRPKPPSLKEQALMALEDGETVPGASLTATEVSIIRRALEALDD